MFTNPMNKSAESYLVDDDQVALRQLVWAGARAVKPTIDALIKRLQNPTATSWGKNESDEFTAALAKEMCVW